MKNKNWSIKVNDLPHKPYSIIDEDNQVICNLFGHLNDEDNAKLISLAPKYKELILSVNEYFSSEGVVIDEKAIKLLHSIAQVELHYYEIIE